MKIEAGYNIGIGDYCIALLFLAGSFLLYFATLAPTALWGDSANHILYTYNIRLTTAHGFYPLHTIIGWLFRHMMPSRVAFSQNLLSAVMACFAVAITYLSALTITGARIPSVLAAAALGVSHTFWFLAVINDSYSLNLLLFGICILTLLLWARSRRPAFLYAFSFASGYSFFASYTALFLAPAAVFLLWTRREALNAKITVRALSYLALGLVPWLFCLLSDVARQGSLQDFIDWFGRDAIHRQFLRAVRPEQALSEIFRYPAYLFYQFPIAGFLLGIIGLIKSRKDDIVKFLAIIFITVIVYASSFYYQRHFYIYVYSYLAFSFFVGLGIKEVFADRKRAFKAAVAAILIIMPLLSYSVILRLIPKDIPFLFKRDVPYRDNLKYFLSPSKKDYRGTYEYAWAAFNRTKKGDEIIADFTLLTVLKYFKDVEHIGGEGVAIILDENIDIPEYIDKRFGLSGDIYLADDENFYDVAKLKSRYDLVRSGVLYKVQKR